MTERSFRGEGDTRPNVSFLSDYAPMRDALLNVAHAFARGCQDTGLYGLGPMDCRRLAIEAKAKLECLHEQLLAASDTSLDRAVLHVRFVDALGVIFSRHGHNQPEVQG
jgi:hypothetical protein